MNKSYDVYMCRKPNPECFAGGLLSWVNSMSDEERQEKVWNYWMEKVKREGGIKSPIADYLSKKGA